ncbi:MAG: FAD-binding oxidoreductase [Planctomycetota bacterium]|nr:FAD-binding oxidoreductase [Planctomycetota bacterium]
MAKVLEPNATIVGKSDLSEGLSIFKVALDEELPEGDWFVPGQYMVIGVNNLEEPDLGGVQRPMSIASEPAERGHVEFYIRRVARPESKNPLTHSLFLLSEGERVFLRPKPKGHFTVPGTVGLDDDRCRIYVSAGTGLAPFVSIVRDDLRQGRSIAKTCIIHGVSRSGDLGYRDELEQWSAEHGLVYIPTVSRPAECPDWSGRSGRAEDCFNPDGLDLLESKLSLSAGSLGPDQAVVLVCGLQGTIGESILRLAGRGFVPAEKKIRKALGIPESLEASLFFEQYDSDPVIDLENKQVVARLRADLGLE